MEELSQREGDLEVKCVVIKYNKLSLIKKKYKNKRELKTETRNDPLTTHTRTQTNTYEHWSRRPIRRSVPIGDDRQAPEQRRHNKGESQRQNRIHAQTQGHTEQTAEHCHRGTITNRRMIHSDASNRIHPVQGRVSPFPAFHSYPLFLSSPRTVDRGSCIQGTDIKTHQRKIIPIFFHYITTALSLPLHNIQTPFF